MDYNTQRKKLILPEYGRCIQQMVDYAKTIGDRAERQNCANTIIALMANMQEQRTDPDELRNKLWNHLAAMADYELDIDYPVEIVHHEEAKDKRERLPYPQHKIEKRHYGYIVESLIRKLSEIEVEDERVELAGLVANQMKRSLASWNRDALDDDKILEDLARATDGKVDLKADNFDFIPDNSLFGNVQQAKKKKRK